MGRKPFCCLYIFCWGKIDLGYIYGPLFSQGSLRSPKDSSYSKRVPKSSAIKVIDFGSTTYDRLDQTYIVSTRHYRAPEVILGIFYSDVNLISDIQWEIIFF